MRLLTFIFLLFTFLSAAQTFPYDIKLDSVFIPQLGGLQSFTVGQANGKWLIIGGRLDGLHRRQPFAAFDFSGHNNQLIVVDPIDKRKWTKSLDEFPEDIREQFSSGNMEFFQRGDYLYIAGGYGYSAKKQDHITYPFFSVVDVPQLIEAVMDDRNLVPYVSQVYDEEFAITGGQLQVIGSTFYLVGGHRFDGRYNPNSLNTFVQTYTNSVKKFSVELENGVPKVNHLKTMTDEKLLHRRDLNVLPQIMPNGNEALIAFSGVFQHDVDVPFLNSVEIYRDTVKQVPHFAQYYNQYHCASLSMYQPNQEKMYNLFFGGISQYYDSSGILVQDNDVPFVKTISCVSRDKNGWMEEFKLPVGMPAYLGAASEFIINPDLPRYENEVIKMDSLFEDTVLLGYIFGGVHSSAANIFWINTGVESKASQMIYPIYLIKNQDALTNVNDQSKNTFQLQVFPNPVDNELSITFTNPKRGNVEILLENTLNEVAYQRTLKNLPAGEFSEAFRYRKLERGDVYYLKVTIGQRQITQKILVH